jgi:hypothetical protein
MKKKEPTQGQFQDLWKTSKELGLDRETVETIKPEIEALMKRRGDEILADRENTRVVELKAVIKHGEYTSLLKEGAPDTPSNFNSWKVGDKFPRGDLSEGKHDYVLRNFPKGGGSFEKALNWARTNGYKLALPQEVFAVTAQHDLCQVIGRNGLYLVATTECSFEGFRQAVCVYVDGSDRSADLSWLGDFGDGSDWFLFRE